MVRLHGAHGFPDVQQCSRPSVWRRGHVGVRAAARIATLNVLRLRFERATPDSFWVAPTGKHHASAKRFGKLSLYFLAAAFIVLDLPTVGKPAHRLEGN
jgi:hypothetical protein